MRDLILEHSYSEASFNFGKVLRDSTHKDYEAFGEAFKQAFKALEAVVLKSYEEFQIMQIRMEIGYIG